MIFDTATGIREVYVDAVALTDSGNGVVHHRSASGVPLRGWELTWDNATSAIVAAIDEHFEDVGLLLKPFSYWPRGAAETVVMYEGPPSINRDNNGSASISVRVVQLLAS